MVRNYLKIALRYLLRHKGYTAINILGLAVGISCFLLIMLFVKSEFSYDKFNQKSDRIYRAWQHEKYSSKEDFVNTVTPLSMANVLQTTFPEIEATSRVFTFSSLVKKDANAFSETVHVVDNSFFQIFDFDLLEGSPKTPFPANNSIILTEKTAQKYFGKENPIGKNLELQLGENKMPFTVSGLAKNPPQESSIRFDMLISFANEPSLFRERARTSWFSVFVESYILLKPNQDMAKLEAKFPAMIKQQLGERYKEGTFMIGIQPLTNIHLDDSLPPGIEPVSNPKYSYILSTIGLLILLLACINFITLSVGRSTTRAMEVGVRKAMGAMRQQLIRQFWGEALIVTLISVILGIGLSALFINPFNELTGKFLSLQLNATFWLFMLILIAFIGFVAGVYPALILSSFNPVEVLKGKLKMGSTMGFMGKSLIVGQFVASIGMIVCTLVIGNQVEYLKGKDLGYQKEQVVIVPTNKRNEEGIKLADLYIEELKKQPQVVDATVSLFSFIENQWMNVGFTDSKKVYQNFQLNAIYPSFLDTYKIKLQSGRNFQIDNTADKFGAIIVNETFVKEFRLKDPIGKNYEKFDAQIVGIVKDFNYEPLHHKIKPLMLVMRPDSILRKAEDVNVQFTPQPRVSVRMQKGNISSNIAILKKAWQSIAGYQEFEYKFLDESLANQYKQEQRSQRIVEIASFLSIFIACMGLFGLATLAVTRRTKEIGIRKVLGASVFSIISMLSIDFIKLILIATAFAFPLAWWTMNQWLKDFAYRVNISWWVFAVAGLSILLIALLTVSYQAIKAALMNPVKSLKTE